MKKSRKLMLIVSAFAVVPALIGDFAFGLEFGEQRSGVGKDNISCGAIIKEVVQSDEAADSAKDTQGTKAQTIK